MIGVMRGGAVGDFVLTLPAINALRSAHPAARLRLLGNPGIAVLANPDEIVDQGYAEFASLYTPAGCVTGRARDALRDLDLLVAYSTDADRSIEGQLADRVPGRLIVHDPRPPQGFTGHITDHLLDPVRRLGLPIPDPLPTIHVADRDRAWAADLCGSHGIESPFVVVHPGSGGRRKCWPVEQFVGLIRGLVQTGVTALVLHGPAEVDLLPALQSGLPPEAQLMASPELPRLAALLATGTLFVGNDSGPGHIAAAVGTSTLSLFGPTDPQVWAPRSNRARWIQAPGEDLAELGIGEVLDTSLDILAGSVR